MSELLGGTLTMLHTDVENSTPLTVRLGDRYPEVLATHCTLLRAAFAAHAGREVDTQGDSFFVVFSRATQAVAAIRCGCAIRDALQGLGIAVKVGIHAGEVESDDRSIGGITVFTVIRITAAAQPGEVLVSNTIKDLVAGSGITFTDRGTHILRGLPGEWRLYTPDEREASAHTP